jgi:hypothetical protein
MDLVGDPAAATRPARERAPGGWSDQRRRATRLEVRRATLRDANIVAPFVVVG